MQLSEFIGKPVLSPAGASYGYVLAARPARDFRAIACLVCADADEEEFYLPMRAVRSSGDALIAGKARLTSPTGVAFPVGRAAYTSEGEFLGTVCDAELKEDPELILFDEGETFPVPVRLAAFGERVVLYKTESEKNAAVRMPQRKKKNGATMPEMDTESVQNEATMPETETSVSETEPSDTVPKPERPNAIRLLNHNNLLGRRVKRSVFDSFGNPVALAGERVTPAMLSAARKCNRLLELTVNTLTALY